MIYYFNDTIYVAKIYNIYTCDDAELESSKTQRLIAKCYDFCTPQMFLKTKHIFGM